MTAKSFAMITDWAIALLELEQASAATFLVYLYAIRWRDDGISRQELIERVAGSTTVDKAREQLRRLGLTREERVDGEIRVLQVAEQPSHSLRFDRPPLAGDARIAPNKVPECGESPVPEKRQPRSRKAGTPGRSIPHSMKGEIRSEKCPTTLPIDGLLVVSESYVTSKQICIAFAVKPPNRIRTPLKRAGFVYDRDTRAWIAVPSEAVNEWLRLTVPSLLEEAIKDAYREVWSLGGNLPLGDGEESWSGPLGEFRDLAMRDGLAEALVWLERERESSLDDSVGS